MIAASSFCPKCSSIPSLHITAHNLHIKCSCGYDDYDDDDYDDDASFLQFHHHLLHLQQYLQQLHLQFSLNDYDDYDYDDYDYDDYSSLSLEERASRGDADAQNEHVSRSSGCCRRRSTDRPRERYSARTASVRRSITSSRVACGGNCPIARLTSCMQ